MSEDFNKGRAASGPSSGLASGCEAGLSKVMPIDGKPDEGQKTVGADQKPMQQGGSAGSNAGKSFKWM